LYSNLFDINIVTEAEIDIVDNNESQTRRLLRPFEGAPQLEFNWNVEKHNPTFIEVQLNPSNPKMLS